MSYPIHPAAGLIREMTDEEYEALRADIERHGQMEPILLIGKQVIDGRHRLRACEELGIEPITERLDDDTDPARAVLSLNVVRRHLDRGERMMRASAMVTTEHGGDRKAIKLPNGNLIEGSQNCEPSEGSPNGKPSIKSHKCDLITREQAAKLMGVSPRSVDRATAVWDSGDDKLIAQVFNGEVSVSKAAKTVERRDRDAAAERERIQQHPAPPETSSVLHVCAVGDLHEIVAPGSVDLILTDPPYPAKFLPVWSELAGFAAHALRDGGILAAMSGQSHLPRVLAGLEAGADGSPLTYRWCSAMTGMKSSLWVPRARHHSRWKPVIVYSLGAFAGSRRDTFDVSAGSDGMQDHHHWGQDLDGWLKLQDAYSGPGQVVCDPFVGGGTAAVAARIGGRSFVGADIDEGCIATTRERLAS